MSGRQQGPARCADNLRRFPTEKEAEEKNMIHYLQERDDTQCRIHDYNCKDALRPYQM